MGEAVAYHPRNASPHGLTSPAGPSYVPAETIRALVVDEHPVVLAGLEAILNVPDIEVVGACATVREAQVLGRRFRPHVAIIEVCSDAPDGFEPITLMKSACPETKVFVFSSRESTSLLVKAALSGASGFLRKGTYPGEILHAVRTARHSTREHETEFLRQVLGAVSPTTCTEGVTPRGAISILTKREMQVLALVAEGLSNQAIADHLGLHLCTVKTFMKRIFSKLGVSSRSQATLWALRHGVAPLH